MLFLTVFYYIIRLEKTIKWFILFSYYVKNRQGSHLPPRSRCISSVMVNLKYFFIIFYEYVK